jgi:hypothetical protein
MPHTDHLSQLLYCPMNERSRIITHQGALVELGETGIPAADKACSHPDVLVGVVCDLELAKLPASGRLAVDRDIFLYDVVLYSAKVEAETDAEGLCVGFLEGPHPVEAADRLRFWDVSEQGGQLEGGELGAHGEPRARTDGGGAPGWRRRPRIRDRWFGEGP